MTGLQPSGILNAWEAGLNRQPLDRALCILWAAGFDDAPVDWPLADRDRVLLEIRQRTLGEQITLLTTCPDCGTELEMDVAIADLIPRLVVPDTDEVEIDGRVIRIRPLTSADLAAAASTGPEDLANLIRARVAGDVPVPDRGAVDAAIEARAELTELRFALHCLDCDASWSEPLDVAGCVWREFDVVARRTLSEVAELARAFGWSEPQSLALSPQRRAAYLSLARAT